MNKKLTLQELEIKAYDIRMDLIRMLEQAGSGHSAGPLGLADIFTALYFDIMRYDPKNPDWDERDIMLLSNGHCVPIQYVTMAHAGFFDKSELKTLRQFGSRLQGHPERLKLPGLENTSGPLGCGLSQAAGMALAMRMNQQHHRWIYVGMSDGEQDEGNVWEAALLASKYKLNNIIAITDRNNIQIDGPTEEIMPLGDLKAKWEAFGWHVIEIDGNNMEAVIDACAMGRAVVEKPVMIIAYTVPGKGVKFMEYDFHWHGAPPGGIQPAGSPEKASQAKIALHELRTLQGKIRSEHE
ncbi:MAG TPA: transketolase [Candidatus Limnocylindria bacterium]|nr:transketolase [Candidatus Limnocylindria bacterium]